MLSVLLSAVCGQMVLHGLCLVVWWLGSPELANIPGPNQTLSDQDQGQGFCPGQEQNHVHGLGLRKKLWAQGHCAHTRSALAPCHERSERGNTLSLVSSLGNLPLIFDRTALTGSLAV